MCGNLRSAEIANPSEPQTKSTNSPEGKASKIRGDDKSAGGKKGETRGDEGKKVDKRGAERKSVVVGEPLNPEITELAYRIFNANLNKMLTLEEKIETILSEEKLLGLEALKSGLDDQSDINDNSSQEWSPSMCLIAQTEELDSLSLILQGEFTLSLTRPLSLAVRIKLTKITYAEVAMLLPYDYPLNTKGGGIILNAYIGGDTDGKMTTNMVTILRQKVDSLKGQGLGYIFDIIEEARGWLHENIKISQVGKMDSVRNRNRSRKMSRSPSPRRSAGKRKRRNSQGKGSKSWLSTDLIDIDKSLIISQKRLDNELSSRLRKITKLGLSAVSAHHYLNNTKWNVQDTTEKILADLSRAHASLKTSGEKLKPRYCQAAEATETKCLACFDDVKGGEGVRGRWCDHAMCHECWGGYLRSALSDGKTLFRCPGPKCMHMLPESAILPLIDDPKLPGKLRRWQCQEMVKRAGFLFCPNQRCGKMIMPVNGGWREFGSGRAGCTCGTRWCGGCQGEIHYPVSCDAWEIFNTSRAVINLRKDFRLEDITTKPPDMIRIKTKSCPKCRVPWEKNGGCNHFTCTCGHEFCWICLRPWSTHGTSYYKCVNTESKQVKPRDVTFYQDNPTYSLSTGRVRPYLHKEMLHFAVETELKDLERSPEKLQEALKELDTKKGGCGMDQADVAQAARFLISAHIFVRSCYVFMALHNNANVAFDFTDPSRPYGRMMRDVNMVEYFVEILDAVLLVMPWYPSRSKRDKDQISSLSKSIRNCARKASSHIKPLLALCSVGGIDNSKTTEATDWEKEADLIRDRAPNFWACRSCTFYNEIEARVLRPCNICEASPPEHVSKAMQRMQDEIKALEIRKAAEVEAFAEADEKRHRQHLGKMKRLESKNGIGNEAERQRITKRYLKSALSAFRNILKNKLDAKEGKEDSGLRMN